jgi:hypothetical protein
MVGTRGGLVKEKVSTEGKQGGGFSPSIMQPKAELEQSSNTAYQGTKTGKAFKTKNSAKNALKRLQKADPDAYKDAEIVANVNGKGFWVKKVKKVSKSGSEVSPNLTAKEAGNVRKLSIEQQQAKAKETKRLLEAEKMRRERLAEIPELLKSQKEGKEVGKKVSTKEEALDLKDTLDFWESQADAFKKMGDEKGQKHAEQQAKRFKEAVKAAEISLKSVEVTKAQQKGSVDAAAKAVKKIKKPSIINNEKGEIPSFTGMSCRFSYNSRIGWV